MGIYYCAVDFEDKTIINPPPNFSCKFPGLVHPKNPFSCMVIMMNARGYSYEIVIEFFESGYKDITEQVYKEYKELFGSEIE